MKKVTLKVPDYVFTFYAEIGKQAGGLSAEKVMADSLLNWPGSCPLTQSV